MLVHDTRRLLQPVSGRCRRHARFTLFRRAVPNAAISTIPSTIRPQFKRPGSTVSQQQVPGNFITENAVNSLHAKIAHNQLQPALEFVCWPLSQQWFTERALNLAHPQVGCASPPDLTAKPKADEFLAYFADTWALTEVLFASLKSEAAFYVKPKHGLRHPLIFYYGHVAAFYVNKLRMAGLLSGPLDERIETLMSQGVFEREEDKEILATGFASAQHMHKDQGRGLWPTVEEVHSYRTKVFDTVADLISGLDEQHITPESPWWALPMAFEHERVHVETSAVLIRELPIEFVGLPKHWAAEATTSSKRGFQERNRFVHVPGEQVRLGIPAANALFFWDLDGGSAHVDVATFQAQEKLVSNDEFLTFLEDGAYTMPELWTTEGWGWLQDRVKKSGGMEMMPWFWRRDVDASAQGSNILLRRLFDEVPLPLDFPAIVNAHEATAYCAWLARRHQRAPGTYRLLTEAEHQLLQKQHGADDVTGCCFNLSFKYGSEAPVDDGLSTSAGFHGVRGNVWQWCADKIAGLPGFSPHPLYEDYSMPYFDGNHIAMRGGSFLSSGSYASEHARNYFLPHFFQTAGFRVAMGGTPPAVWPETAWTSPQISQADEDQQELRPDAGPVAVLDDIASLKLNLDDRLTLQSCWTDMEKGWLVAVERRRTHDAGLALFAKEKILKGRVLRQTIIGKNLVRFRNKEDIYTFLKTFPSEMQGSVCKYIADYTFGLNGLEGGEYFYGLFFPGNGPNHSKERNSGLQYVYSSDGQVVGLNYVALDNIDAGQEIWDDYSLFGEAPSWLMEWHAEHCQQLKLTFPGTNDYV